MEIPGVLRTMAIPVWRWGVCEMAEEMQAPIARGDFQVWAWNTYRLYGKIRLVDGSVLGCTKYELLPEVNALFIGSPENLHATMDLCGLYDKRLGEFWLHGSCGKAPDRGRTSCNWLPPTLNMLLRMDTKPDHIWRNTTRKHRRCRRAWMP